MNYHNHNGHRMQHNPNNFRQMEDEMSRFEAEISHGYNQQHQSNYGQFDRGQAGPNNFQFIPHQLQRHLPPRPMGGQGVQHQPSYNQVPPQIQPHIVSSQHPPPSQASVQSPVGYTVTPMGLPPAARQTTAVPETTKSKSKSSEGPSGSKKKNKKVIRTAGGQVWEDNNLAEWDSNDFRLFCGDLGNDVTDDVLTRAFNKYTSFQKCKVVRDRKTNKSKGYGFISFKDAVDFARAMREMNGKYVGSRPIKLRKSSWQDRNVEVVKKKKKERAKLGLL
ncbi:RNA-binding protein 42 [Halotydeus destructor]|nr:RNA-binding protein 42 [Halotydeus destructor]